MSVIYPLTTLPLGWVTFTFIGTAMLTRIPSAQKLYNYGLSLLMIVMTAIEVLKTVKKEPRLTPPEIAKRVNVTRQYVRNILMILAQLRLVETPARGVYLITDLGETVLEEISEGE